MSFACQSWCIHMEHSTDVSLASRITLTFCVPVLFQCILVQLPHPTCFDNKSCCNNKGSLCVHAVSWHRLSHWKLSQGKDVISGWEGTRQNMHISELFDMLHSCASRRDDFLGLIFTLTWMSSSLCSVRAHFGHSFFLSRTEPVSRRLLNNFRTHFFYGRIASG
jgi:hypothetical protein